MTGTVEEQNCRHLLSTSYPDLCRVQEAGWVPLRLTSSRWVVWVLVWSDAHVCEVLPGVFS